MVDEGSWTDYRGIEIRVQLGEFETGGVKWRCGGEEELGGEEGVFVVVSSSHQAMKSPPLSPDAGSFTTMSSSSGK